MKAIHFGAGNIGRGFVGLILHDAGYEVVFADVNADLIDALDTSSSYLVREVGAGASIRTVNNYRALNSAKNEAAVIAEIATADVVTTAVGPNILKFVGPLIAQGIALRDSSRAPLTVMACENAISATDTLKESVMSSDPDLDLSVAVFANTAVDRIVPAQDPSAGLDVTVETFFEWAIEKAPFRGNEPRIPLAHFVDDLAPYIERKLFTVNTGHAATAYHGFLAGATSISEAIAIPQVLSEVRAVLAETSALLVAKHGFAQDVQSAYMETNLERFANTELTDTVERVGRQPLRKLSRHERFIGPAAEIAEGGTQPVALLRAMESALHFDVPSDPESHEMRSQLASLSATDFTRAVTGLNDEHPLFALVVAAVSRVQ
jgi:mannitol-1-phosphate 5-dehydrogenase